MGMNPSLLREDLQLFDILISPSSLGWLTRDVVPDCITSFPLFPVSAYFFFLYNLSCGRTSLQVFRSFSERAVLNVVVVLVCLWEVNSGSFSTLPS